MRYCPLILLAAFCGAYCCGAEPASDLEKRAERGETAAQLELAGQRLNGTGFYRQNPALAFYWFKRAAESGSPEAQYNLGRCYESGIGTARNPFAAFEYYKLAAGAKLAPARFRISQILASGIRPEVIDGEYHSGIAANPPQALEILNQLVQENYPPALLMAGETMLAGVPADSEQAKLATEYIRRAADAGDLRAMRIYADCLYRGIGCPADPVKMASYLKKGADRGDAESAVLYAGALEYGIGLAPDPELAFRYYAAAAQRGVPAAYVRMAEYKLQGSYVAADPVGAVELLKSAAESGVASSFFRLGECYADGVGMAQNEKAAFRCFLQGASKGEPNAQYRLALAFRDGKGTPKDPSAVVFWLRYAARGGHPDAAVLLKQINPEQGDSK